MVDVEVSNLTRSQVDEEGAVELARRVLGVEGVIHVLRTQRNMRIHFLVAAVVLVVAFAAGVTNYELIALLLSIAFVLIAEMINTAI